MKIRLSLVPLLVFVPGLPLLGQDAPRSPDAPPAQQVTPAQAVPAVPDAPPAQLDSLELSRSQACVAGLARLAALEDELEPINRRAQRLQALDFAITREDSLRAVPFDTSDVLEGAVREWFRSDGELARQIVAGGGDTLQVQRTQGREQVRQRLREALEALQAEARQKIDAAGDVDTPARECQDVVLVRSAVLEACTTTPSPVCEAARDTAPQAQLRFVDSPEDLWDLEQLRPWTQPTPLFRTADGALGGARTGALARRGKVVLAMTVEPLIRARSTLDSAQIAEFDAHLDSLGFTFDDPNYVMAPALAVHLSTPGLLGGETHYLVHFGDMSAPDTDLLWNAEVAGGAPIEVIFPASGSALDRLAAGEAVSLTAVRIPEGPDREAEPIFTLTLPSLGQVESVAGLVAYMKEGRLARDLAALTPPGDAGG